LEWELQLINKDHETRKLIFDILTQKDEIEMYAKATERQPEEYLKDIKELTSNSYNIMNQHPESEREKERARRKLANKRKLDKQYEEDVKKWVKHEEDKERERQRSKISEEDLHRRKKRLVEKDLNIDSEEDKKYRENPKRIEELKFTRMKENEFDEMMKRKDNPHLNIPEQIINNTVTDIVPVEINTDIQTEEQAEKVLINVKEYIEEDEDHPILPQVCLNIEKKTIKKQSNIEDYEHNDINDPYGKKESVNLEIDEETVKHFMEINKDLKQSREEEEKIKQQQKQIKNIVNKSNSNESSQKLIELQKEIFASIPKGKDDLFKFPINWNYLIKVK
jgi:hypothetical protein